MGNAHPEREEIHHRNANSTLTRAMANPVKGYERAGMLREVKRLELQMTALSSEVESEIRLLGIKSGMGVLDAGCGSGAFARRIASLVAPTNVHAVDSDLVFLREAEKLAKREGIGNIVFERGDVIRMRFEDSAFDLTYCRLVLPHVQNRERLMSELRRVTKAGGLVASSEIGYSFNYPPMPKFESLFKAIANWRSRRTRMKLVPMTDVYEIFKQEGFDSVKAFPIPVFASQNERERLVRLALVQKKMLEIHKEAAITGGFVKRDAYVAGMAELRDWLAKPLAFTMVLSTLVLGRVPPKRS